MGLPCRRILLSKLPERRVLSLLEFIDKHSEHFIAAGDFCSRPVSKLPDGMWRLFCPCGTIWVTDISEKIGFEERRGQ